MGITPNLTGQAWGLAVVVLPQLDPQAIRQLHQMLATTFQQATVGRVGNGLLHDRRINDHFLQARCLDDLGFPGSFDGRGQQPFHTFLADALAPAGERRGINGRLVLKVGFTAEVLPVRVLHPGPD